ncbi:TetR family transcriptional regulator [Streptomyces phaeolivaceus]|uniref:TetR family transcriptional regulator n=1 Tax=Streptomyces phaeolivaceus TaxID=2653200 RepID=A0A5P8KE55_9ACTN|nr:TetR family transcriptional regulator [Streptomyces phaeolivaceus]QFR01614.1 TetR family transcriptional regulator [Streptomyces phaeolivaceus]
MTSTGESLRERRRQQTRREIHAVALRLAQEQGFDGITVDLISAEAGVSPRTFFNYFPNKEAAVLPGPPAELPQALTAEFVSRGDAHPREVLADLTRLLVRDLTDNPPLRQETHAAFALTRSHPALLATMLARFDGFRRSIAELVARRLGARPEGEVPTLIAALALTVMRDGLERWANEESPSDEDDSPVPHVERSAKLLLSLLTP